MTSVSAAYGVWYRCRDLDGAKGFGLGSGGEKGFGQSGGGSPCRRCRAGITQRRIIPGDGNGRRELGHHQRNRSCATDRVEASGLSAPRRRQAASCTATPMPGSARQPDDLPCRDIVRAEPVKACVGVYHQAHPKHPDCRQCRDKTGQRRRCPRSDRTPSTRPAVVPGVP